MIALKLSALALRNFASSPLITEAIGPVMGGLGKDLAEAGFNRLVSHLTRHDLKLVAALKKAHEQAWKTLEIALGGRSVFGGLFTSAQDRALRNLVKTLLDDLMPADDEGFRMRCLTQLRKARERKVLTFDAPLSPEALAREVGPFVQFSDPGQILDAEKRILSQVALDLRGQGYSDLARVLTLQPVADESLLAVAVRYYFRLEVGQDQELCNGLAVDRWAEFDTRQVEGFTLLAAVQSSHGEQLERALEQLLKVGEEVGRIGEDVRTLLGKFDLLRKEIHPRNSFSIRGQDEANLIKRVLSEYRALSEESRRSHPLLRNSVGKLEFVAGQLEEARTDFEAAAAQSVAPQLQAKSHFNAYRTKLELDQPDLALADLRRAMELDPGLYEPLPTDRYEILEILGAGGFGVAFLCQARDTNRRVVFKSLLADSINRPVDQVFDEGYLLDNLTHEAIVRHLDSGYMDRANKLRPWMMPEYFEGMSLERHVNRNGQMPVSDLIAIARIAAQALDAAHRGRILHRDVKPANLLVRRESHGWKVKLIDFGLALHDELIQGVSGRPGSSLRSVFGQSIVGTFDYAAPEQLGKTPGAKTEVQSDIYGWGKTCYFALFQTPDPDPDEIHELPQHLRDLLIKCTSRKMDRRPKTFQEVIASLEAWDAPLSEPPPRPGTGPRGVGGDGSPPPSPRPGVSPHDPPHPAARKPVGGSRVVYYKGEPVQLVQFGPEQSRVEPTEGGESSLVSTYLLTWDQGRRESITLSYSYGTVYFQGKPLSLLKYGPTNSRVEIPQGGKPSFLHANRELTVDPEGREPFNEAAYQRLKGMSRTQDSTRLDLD